MSRNRLNSILLFGATALWAGVIYSPLFPTFFWTVVPAVVFSAVITGVLCSILNAGRFVRALLSLAPPAVVLGMYVTTHEPDRAFGWLPVAAFAVPTLFTATGWMLQAVIRRTRPNTSFKVTPDGAPQLDR